MPLPLLQIYKYCSCSLALGDCDEGASANRLMLLLLLLQVVPPGGCNMRASIQTDAAYSCGCFAPGAAAAWLQPQRMVQRCCHNRCPSLQRIKRTVGRSADIIEPAVLV